MFGVWIYMQPEALAVMNYELAVQTVNLPAGRLWTMNRELLQKFILFFDFLKSNVYGYSLLISTGGGSKNTDGLLASI